MSVADTAGVKVTEAHQSLQKWLKDVKGVDIPVEHVATSIALHGTWQGSPERRAERKTQRADKLVADKQDREAKRQAAEQKRVGADKARQEKEAERDRKAAERDKKREDAEAERDRKAAEREQKRLDKEAEKAQKAADREAAKKAKAEQPAGADGDDSTTTPTDGKPTGRGALQDAKRQLHRKQPATAGRSAGQF